MQIYVRSMPISLSGCDSAYTFQANKIHISETTAVFLVDYPYVTEERGTVTVKVGLISYIYLNHMFKSALY